MKCPECNFENPQGAKFCMECGKKLENVCSQCGKKLPQEAKFCMECGTKVREVSTESPKVTLPPKLEAMREQLQRFIPKSLAEKMYLAERGMEGENRLVTTLFADISGFTSMSQDLPTEAVVEKLNQCFQVVIDAVYRYEGSINRFIGDCVLAFFGAPLTHENDPERAILAGLDIRESVSKLDLNISVGINTGMMYFGLIGTRQHSEISAYGMDIILAKRFQEAAQPGQILVGEGTYRPTRRAFEFEPLLPLTLRGIPEPVSAYQVLKVLPKPEKIRGIEGLKAEMIGREKEFDNLKGCVNDLLTNRGQIVSIIGEAGVGKSRLSTELKEYIKDKEREGDKPVCRLLEGRCVSIGESIGYWVFTDILRSYLEFSDEDGPQEMGKKILAKIKTLFPKRWEDIVPYISNLLSVKFGNEWDEKIKYLTPEQIKYQTSLTLKDLFLALANQKPLLLILEDIHWADDLSLDLIALLMDELTHGPLMLLCIYRPEKEHRSWHIGTQASVKCVDRYSEITLRELNPQESQLLVESLLRIENLPGEVKESILRKAEGNPFFVEEVIRSFIQRGFVYQDGERWVAKADIEEITVPDTIQSVIMARIDGLEDEVRYVSQCASVIGKLFRHKLLQYTMPQEKNLDEYLWQLQEKELVYEERAIPELEYSFRHVLIQETLYQNLLTRHRQVFHQNIGDGIEMLYQDRIEEFYEELAWHYSQSDNLPKAIDYSLKAGKKAKGMYANQEAIRYFKRALEFLQSQPADEKQISLEMTAHELLGDVLFATGEHHEAEVHFNHSLNLASKQEDVRHIATLTCKLADIIHWQGDYDRAIGMAESGLKALGEQIHCIEAANLLEVISRSYHSKRDLESAHRCANKIAQIIRQISYFDSIYKLYYWLAYLEMGMSNFEEALNWLEELEQICLEHGNEVGLARCYHGLGDLWHYRDSQQASQWLKKSLDYCERVGDAHLLMEGHLELAHLLILLDGNPNQIEVHIQRGLQIADQMANNSRVASAPILCGMLGDAYLQKGDVEQAQLHFRRALEFGMPATPLSKLLHSLEQFYVQQGQHEAFFDFCQRTQQEITSSLRYWHLQPGAPSTDYSQLTWWDSFEETSLREAWGWINPQGESSYDFVQQGILELQTPSGHDLSSANSNAPRLLRQISGDFAAETKLVDITEEESQIGGLLFWESERSYLIFGKFSSINEVRLEACQQGNHEITGRGWLPGYELYLRLERRGKSVSALCSNDGENWQSCGETSFSVASPIWVGLYAACPANLPASVVRFKEFKLFQQVEPPENREVK